MAAETPREIANWHTLFNVANTFIFIWFTGPIAALLAWVVPVRPTPPPKIEQPRYLDAVYLETPAMAVDRIRMECGHLGALVLGSVDSVAVGEGLEDPQRIGDNIEDVDVGPRRHHRVRPGPAPARRGRPRCARWRTCSSWPGTCTRSRTRSP